MTETRAAEDAPDSVLLRAIQALIENDATELNRLVGVAEGIRANCGQQIEAEESQVRLLGALLGETSRTLRTLRRATVAASA